MAHSLGIEADEAAGAKTPDAWHVLRAQGHELEPIACSEKVSRDGIAEIEFAERIRRYDGPSCTVAGDADSAGHRDMPVAVHPRFDRHRARERNVARPRA